MDYMLEEEQTVKELAEHIQQEGGRAMLVGGCVRDEIMGLVPKDFDVEVYGLSAEKLQEVIAYFGKVDAVGASFQVYKVGQNIDVSLPRRERKTGVGHKGFTVEGDPDMSFEEACSRRDFTINAIMKDPLTGEIVDPFNGREAIRTKTLKVVSIGSFQEDSLRVLRLAQFTSRLGFNVEEVTAKIARMTDLSDLPKERVWMELEKMFLKSSLVNLGVEYMFELGIARKLFPSLNYTNSVQLSLMVADYTDLSEGEKLAVLITLLTLDSDEKVLDELGLSSVGGYDVRKHVISLRENVPIGFLNSDYEFHKLSQHVHMKLAARVLSALDYGEEFTSTIKRLGIEDKPIEPLLKGRDLIEMGLEPSKEFGEILDKVYDAQLRGEIRTLEEGKALVFP